MCCPTCKSESVVKNGFNATGKQMYLSMNVADNLC